MPDPYTDPTTGCLRNRLGITDPRTLRLVEHELVYAREVVLYRERPHLGRFDLDHLRAVHRWLFAELYDWAGELRTVNIAKGGTLFAAAEHLEPQSRRLLGRLSDAKAFLDLDADRFYAEASRTLADLNALHPFRDGNGRTQRAFLQLAANHAGWQIAWGGVDPERNASLSRAAMSDDSAFMALFADITTRHDESHHPDTLILDRRTEHEGPGLEP